MKFKIGERVMVRMTQKDKSDEALDRLDGELGTVLTVYQNAYEPEVDRYEVKLDKPATISGTKTKTYQGLYADNLVKLSNKSLKKVDEAKNRKEYKWYWGMASANGIDSFIEETVGETESLILDLGILGDVAASELEKQIKSKNQSINGAIMAANANPQRRALVYRVNLDEYTAEEIQDLLRSGDPVQALIVLKDFAQEVQVAGVGSKRNWERNPDPNIDPFI
jgi:hypothetical protein